MLDNNDKQAIEKQISTIWSGFLDSVVNADIEHFASFHSGNYLAHMGFGAI